MCVPTLTNWIKPPVSRKGSASVKLTYEEDSHSGWRRQTVGGVGVAGSRCVCHHNFGIMLKERRHYFTQMDISRLYVSVYVCV